MMILHDDLSKDGAYQQYMPNRTTVILQNFPFCFLSTLSKENYERTGNSRKMVVYYSKRFPDMYINSSFYEEIMAIAEMHVGLYQSRGFDFGLQYSESVFNNSIPWNNNRSVLQQPIQAPNTLHSINYNNNSNQRDFANSPTFQVQLPSELVTNIVPTPSSAESFSESTSPLDFDEPIVVTPNKIIPKDDTSHKNSPEENNNKVNVIDDHDGIKNRSISSNSSSSDIAEEKIASYAEVMKCSKPSKPKVSAKAELHVIEKSKKEEPAKTNRIPPSKKLSIKLPDAPLLPNNQFCAFCKNNGEDESVYRTHIVKDEIGNVKCPFLSRYTCPQCKATGTKAHTISRCPFYNKNNKPNK